MGAAGIGAGVGGSLGLLKYLSDYQDAKKDRALQATTARYSPWTGLKPTPVARPNALGDIMSGAGAGAGQGQAFQSAQNQQDLQNQMMQYMQQNPQGQNPMGLTQNPMQQSPFMQGPPVQGPY